MGQSVANRQRLAAILVADAAGYSRLMSVDEAATVAALDLARGTFGASVAAHNGRIVDMAGDSVLAVFDAATGALRAALGAQQELEAAAAGLPEERRMRFRIGLHLGDVIEKDDGTVYGDGVNIAARLQTLAKPGGIMVSDALRSAVGARVPVRFDDQGQHLVKNIAHPVHIFGVSGGANEGNGGARSARGWQKPGRWWLVGVVVAVAFLGAAGLGIGLKSSLSKSTDGSIPAPFTIALLPLSAPSNTPDDEQLAESLTQDLTTALGRWGWGQVSSRGLLASYKGKTVDPRAVGRELRVRHLVEGEVGRSGDDTVVTLRAVDTTTGAQSWSDRMEFSQRLLTTEPMAIVMRSSSHLRNGIFGDEMRRAMQAPDRASALNITLRGSGAWDNGKEDLTGVREAGKLYSEALRLDPNFVHALVARAQAIEWAFYEDLEADHDRLVAEWDALTRRAVALDPLDPSAWGMRASVLMRLGRWDEAAAAVAQAHAVDPVRLWNQVELAWLTYAMGRPAESLAAIERAVAIDPTGSQSFYEIYICWDNLMLGRYAEAMPGCDKAGC